MMGALVDRFVAGSLFLIAGLLIGWGIARLVAIRSARRDAALCQPGSAVEHAANEDVPHRPGLAIPPVQRTTPSAHSATQAAPLGAQATLSAPMPAFRSRAAEPDSPLRIGPSAPEPWHLDADCEVVLHRVDGGLWVANRAGGTAACQLGSLPLRSAAHPVTARSMTLMAQPTGRRDGGQRALVDLASLAAAWPNRPLRLAGPWVERADAESFVAASDERDVVVAISLRAAEVDGTGPVSTALPGLVLDDRTTTDLRALLRDAGELFVPSRSIRYAASALIGDIASLCAADGFSIDVAIAGLDGDDRLVFAASPGVSVAVAADGSTGEADLVVLPTEVGFQNTVVVGMAELPPGASVGITLPGYEPLLASPALATSADR